MGRSFSRLDDVLRPGRIHGVTYYLFAAAFRGDPNRGRPWARYCGVGFQGITEPAFEPMTPRACSSAEKNLEAGVLICHAYSLVIRVATLFRLSR